MDEIREWVKQGQFEAAERALREQLSDTPDHPEALNLFGVVLALRGDVLGARSYFKRAIEAAPLEPSFLVNFGMLLAQQGDSLRANEYLERATALDPNWATAHARLGELALASGQMDAAESRFRTGLRANEQDPTALMGLAQVLLVRGDHDKALSLAQQAAALDPEHPRAQTVLGMVLLAKGHHGFARQAFDNALRIAPEDKHVRRLAARAQLDDGDLNAAYASAASLRDFDAADIGLLRDLSEKLVHAERYAEAIELLDRALPRLPKEARLVHAAAEARARAGRPDAAVSLLAAYTDFSSPNSLWTHQLSLLGRMGLHQEAYELARSWREQQPDNAEAQAEFATAAELRGEPQLAIEAAERALDLDAKQAKALTIAAAYELGASGTSPRLQELCALDPSTLQEGVRITRNFIAGYAADRSGDSDQALQYWLDTHTLLPSLRMPALADPLGPPRELLLPLPVDTETRPLVLLPFIPGSGVEPLLRALSRSSALAVLADRLTGGGRHDGLSPDQRWRVDNLGGEGSLRVFRRRYWRAFERLRVGRDKVVLDVLPALEWAQYVAISGALPEARLIAYVRDPRDALLHWLAYGTTPNRPILKPELAANYLLRQYQHLDRMRSSAGIAVTLLYAEDFERREQGLRDRLAQALGVTVDQVPAQEPERTGVGGLPERLEVGRWRRYAAPLGKAFRLLSPAAKRFGYD